MEETNTIINFLKDYKDAILSIGVGLTFFASMISMYFTVMNNKAVHYVNAITKNRVEWLYKFREYISEFINLTTVEMAEFMGEKEKTDKEYFSNIEKLRSLMYMHLNFKGGIDETIIKYMDQIVKAHKDVYDLCCLYKETKNKERPNIAHLVIYPVVKEIVSDYLKNDNCEDFLLHLKEDSYDYDEFMSYYYNEVIKRFDKISDLRDVLIGHVRIYLKFEWNRIKIEAKGKRYKKRKQNKDLEKLYKDYKGINISVKSEF